MLAEECVLRSQDLEGSLPSAGPESMHDTEARHDGSNNVFKDSFGR
jgi:hypothetical protein